MILNESLFEEYMPREYSEEEVRDALYSFIDSLGHPADIASQFYQFEDTTKSLKALLDRVVGYYKNESLTETKEDSVKESYNETEPWAEPNEKPYNKDEVLEQLVSITNNWTKHSGFLKVYYEEELEYVKDILSEHYDYISTHYKTNNIWKGADHWTYVIYRNPKKED